MKAATTTAMCGWGIARVFRSRVGMSRRGKGRLKTLFGDFRTASLVDENKKYLLLHSRLRGNDGSIQ